MCDELEESLIEFEFVGLYREAVKKLSPALPRFGGYPGKTGLTIANGVGSVSQNSIPG
jgi:hypothetical protein